MSNTAKATASEKTVAFSVKLKPRQKAELDAYLKHIAALKGIAIGDALMLVLGTMKTYGELPAIIHEGFSDFTSITMQRLDEIHSMLILTANGGDIGAANEVDLDHLFEHISVAGEDDNEDADREPVLTRASPKSMRKWKSF